MQRVRDAPASIVGAGSNSSARRQLALRKRRANRDKLLRARLLQSRKCNCEKMLTTGLPSIREMLNEDAHDGTLQGLAAEWRDERYWSGRFQRAP